MLSFVLRLVLGNSPKSQGPNAAFSIQESPREWSKTATTQGRLGRSKAWVPEGSFTVVSSMRSCLQGHAHKDTLNVGCGCRGAILAMILGLQICQNPGKATLCLEC